MFPKKKNQQQRTLTSPAFETSYTDFVLARQAMNCSENTILFYKFTARSFLLWLEEQGVCSPEETNAHHVRLYLAEMKERGKSDTTRHDHARAIRTLTNFWLEENYIQSPIKFEMPKLEKKRLPVLNADQLEKVLKSCDVRDRALTLLLADSGLRREELCKLNWKDVEMKSGLVIVMKGKGGKTRASVIGARTRRALLKYRRTLGKVEDTDPLFQSRTGQRLTGEGVRLIFRRLSIKTGIKVTPHALRRTWTLLCLRAGMNTLHLKALGGWEDMAMLDRYGQLYTEDLVDEHKKHSPIDSLK